LPLPERPTGTLPEFEHVRGDLVRIVRFKNGARCFFETKHGRPLITPERDDDERTIGDQSSTSRRRAAFAFGNAECDWLAMTLLTWEHAPAAADVKPAIDKLRRAWRQRWLEPMDGWVMEMQQRGVPHFHVMHAAQSKFGAVCSGMPRRRVRRRGRLTDLVGGSVENWIVQTWMAITGQSSDAAQSFNRGGIIEFFRTPDAAGRYLAKEACAEKRTQKILPAAYSAGLGRWWWLHRRWHPQPRSVHVGDMTLWPWQVPVTHVWDVAKLADLIRPAEQLPASVGTGRTYQLRRRPIDPGPETAYQKLLNLPRR